MDIINLKSAKNYDKLSAEAREMLDKIVAKHVSSFETWNFGKAKKIFPSDGTLAVKYENDWFHYTESSWY